MSDFATTLKELISRSVKFVNRSAKTATKATQYKVHEMTTLGKRRELVTSLGEAVLSAAHSDIVLPEEVRKLIQQINQIDSDLTILRSDHAAEKAAAAEQHALEKAARAAEKAAAKTAAVIEKSTAPVEVAAPVVATELPPEAESDEPSTPVLELDIEAAMGADEQSKVPTLEV